MGQVARQNYRDKIWNGVASILFGIIICLIIGIYFVSNAVFIYINSWTFTDPLEKLQYVQNQFCQVGLFSYPIACYVLFACLFFLMAIGTYIIYINHYKRVKSPGERATDATHPLDLELSRKVFHIGLIGIVICYIVIGRVVLMGIFGYLSNLFSFEKFLGNFIPYYDLEFNEILPYMGQQITMLALMMIFFFVLFTDFVRLYEPRYNLLQTVSKTWRKSEEQTFGPHIYILLGCMIPVLFFKPPIAAATIGIAALGDAMATIAGVTKGTHRLRETSPKTWEGTIAGTIGSFLFGFLCYLAIISLAPIYGTLYQGSIVEGVIICLVGALTFFVLDFLTPPIPISDNILNPIFCGLTMFFTSLIIS